MSDTKKNARWIETPYDIEMIRKAAQAGKIIASWGKRDTIARKATHEELLDTGDGEFWYALIVNRRVEWWAAPLSSVQMFALKRRLNLYAAFV